MRPFRPVAIRQSTVTLAMTLLACEPNRPLSPAGTQRLSAAKHVSALEGGAFFVGNFLPGPGSTNGILRYTALGEFVDVFAPVGSGGLTIGCCLAFGPDDNLYVGSPLTASVLRYNGATGQFIDEFVTPGSGGLVSPVVIAFGPDGNLYVGDFGAGRAEPAVRRYDGRSGAFLDVFVEANGGGMVGAPDPQHFAWGPDGNVYVAAPAAGKVLRFDGRTGHFLDAFVTNEAGRPPVGGGLAFGPDGALYVASTAAVMRFDGRTGAYIDTFVASGSGGLSGTVGILFGPDGNLYVSDFVIGSVLRYHGQSGAFIDEFLPRGRGPISGPRTIAFKLKLQVCHRPPGHPHEARTISVGQLDAANHVAHGDDVGACR
jgi:DNA-binding beta-propeller fold protein YncE